MSGMRENVYRILIVDDEKNHRKGLMNLLQELYPQSILLEAADGTDALEVMEYIDCDIMVADIQMTNMDGLKLLKKAKEKKPDIEVIILSGHGQFEYAREAIRYGAADYLMKPVDKKEIEEVLNKLMEKLESFKKSIMKKRQVEDELTQTIPVYVEHMMNLLIQEEEFSLKPQIAALFPLMQPGYFFLCHLRALEGGLNEEKRQEIQYVMKKCLDPYSSYAFFWEKNLSVLAVCVIADFIPNMQYFENIKYCMEKENRGICSIYIGKHVENLYTMALQSFAQAEFLWQYHFYRPDGVISYEKIQDKIDKEAELEFDTAAILKLIRNEDVNNAYLKIERVLEESVKNQYPAPVYMKQKTAFLLFQIVRSCELFISGEYKREMNHKVDELLKADTFFELKIKMKQFLMQLGKEMSSYKSRPENSGKDMLVRCKEYLDSHYMDEIGLDQVAEKYYFNPSYFSTLFKSTFDKTFSEYLIELRMDKAKQLLLESGKKVKEIAMEVGYRDANYFVRSFKKYYGITPEECRKQKCRI